MNKSEIQKEIEELEMHLYEPDFWSDKVHAQDVIQKIKDLKAELEGDSVLDKGGAILNILAGAGGDDSEDFAKMLLNMYLKYFEKQGWSVLFLHENQNDHGGYRNLSLEINGKNVYKKLKNESGVHRLVRLSPFNANAKRHTSFVLVEILPILPKLEFDKFKNSISDEEIEIETSKSSGPGGQNVNKRETAVRLVHKPTNISVQISTERSQEQNKEKALALLYAKLFKLEEEKRQAEIEGRQISKTTEIEWGNQIRNYVLHPYKLIKDLRTGVEASDVEKVLEKGELEDFIQS
ncbi:Peptide chain release factor 2 [bioreactor metagenome]|uniref:Peptide chain release factor 2 n=1 Tax=bioreactor metagenome TaxID=1076179 RepID=A0A644T634_9ZZZZ|nr:PCRF domain-containing protein [Candidatus Elulimicrobiales bacterium]